MSECICMQTFNNVLLPPIPPAFVRRGRGPGVMSLFKVFAIHTFRKCQNNICIISGVWRGYQKPYTGTRHVFFVVGVWISLHSVYRRHIELLNCMFYLFIWFIDECSCMIVHFLCLKSLCGDNYSFEPEILKNDRFADKKRDGKR